MSANKAEKSAAVVSVVSVPDAAQQEGAVAESSVVVCSEVVPLVMANSESEMVPSVVTVKAKNDVVSSKKV